jgi:hypothetical protein
MATSKGTSKALIPLEVIQNKIFLIRGLKVMFDKDLAALYGVDTGQLTRQVRRNIDRFPPDFLLTLTRQEVANLKCQFGVSSWGGTRKPPFAFTEHGILMLSSVLNSKRAIQVNIQIMRIFTQLRKMLAGNKELKRKIEEMEKKYDHQFQIVFKAIKELLEPPAPKPKGPIGFHP